MIDILCFEQDNFLDIVAALEEKAWLIHRSILNCTELILEHGSMYVRVTAGYRTQLVTICESLIL